MALTLTVHAMLQKLLGKREALTQELSLVSNDARETVPGGKGVEQVGSRARSASSCLAIQVASPMRRSGFFWV